MCCKHAPIEKEIYERNRDSILRSPNKEMEFYGMDPETLQPVQLVMPITDDGFCPFLREDLLCNIYNDRPKACRKYGDETSKCMRCPFQDKNGRVRSRQESRKILREHAKETQKLVKRTV
jgi:Fe-S-cluster containining protein